MASVCTHNIRVAQGLNDILLPTISDASLPTVYIDFCIPSFQFVHNRSKSHLAFYNMLQIGKKS